MRRTRRAALLALLNDREWHSQSELMKAAGHRFACPINILRDAGYAIETEHLQGNEWRYRLVATPEEQGRIIRVLPDGQATLGLEG